MRCPSCGKKLAEEINIMGSSRVVIVCRHCHTRVEVLDKNRIVATK